MTMKSETYSVYVHPSVTIYRRDYGVLAIGEHKMAKQLNYKHLSTKQRYPLEELIKCATRELAMRQRVYPRHVKHGNMDETEALKEIAMMENIKDILIQLQTTVYMVHAATGE